MANGTKDISYSNECPLFVSDNSRKIELDGVPVKARTSNYQTELNIDEDENTAMGEENTASASTNSGRVHPSRVQSDEVLGATSSLRSGSELDQKFFPLQSSELLQHIGTDYFKADSVYSRVLRSDFL